MLDEYHLEKGVRSSNEKSNNININAVKVSPNATSVSDAPELKKTESQDNSTLERLIARANRNPHSNNRLPRIEGLTVYL